MVSIQVSWAKFTAIDNELTRSLIDFLEQLDFLRDDQEH